MVLGRIFGREKHAEGKGIARVGGCWVGLVSFFFRDNFTRPELPAVLK
jgi:hypothetical protein